MKKYLYIFLVLLVPIVSIASSDSDSENPGDAIIHHLVDSPKWRPIWFLPAISLPQIHIGNLDLSVSVHVLMLWFASIILLALFIPAFRNAPIVPRGIGVLLETLVLFIRNEIVYPTMGAKHGKDWLPFFVTIFMFILTCNLLGMIPLFSTATANINITAGLATLILTVIFVSGFKSLGPIGFFKNLMPHGAPFPFAIFVALIEFIGFFIKSFALCVRLFANMLAGHTVILSLLILIFVLHPVAATVSVPIAIFINLMEIIVALIQALVFTLLSCLFINMACSSH